MYSVRRRLLRSSREPREYVLPWPPLPGRWREWRVRRGERKLCLTKYARHYRKDCKMVAITQTQGEKPFPESCPVRVKMRLWFPYDKGQGFVHQRAATVLEALRGIGFRKLEQVRQLEIERMTNDREFPRVWVRVEEHAPEGGSDG